MNTEDFISNYTALVQAIQASYPYTDIIAGWDRYGRTEIYLSVREPSMVRGNDYRSQPQIRRQDV